MLGQTTALQSIVLKKRVENHNSDLANILNIHIMLKEKIEQITLKCCHQPQSQKARKCRG